MEQVQRNHTVVANALYGGAPPWAMSDLFLAGEQGGYYDPYQALRNLWDYEGTELVTNGTFDSDVTGYSTVAATKEWIEPGRMRVTLGGTTGRAVQVVTVEVGKYYIVRADLFDGTGVALINVGQTSNNNEYSQVRHDKQFAIFKATQTDLYLSLKCGATVDYYGDFDNISVKELVNFDESKISMWKNANGPAMSDVSLIASLEPGDAVGLMLDLSRDLALGDEIVTNGTFDTDLDGWGAGNNTVWDSGTALVTYDGSSSSLTKLIEADYDYIDRWYVIEWDQTIVSGTRCRVRIRNAANNADIEPFNYYVGDGHVKFYARANAGLYLQFLVDDAGGSVRFDNISVKHIMGFHVDQTTTADKPTLSNRTDDYKFCGLYFDGLDDNLSLVGYVIEGMTGDIATAVAAYRIAGTAATYLCWNGDDYEYNRIDWNTAFARAEDSGTNQQSVSWGDTTALTPVVLLSVVKESDRKIYAYRNGSSDGVSDAMGGTAWFDTSEQIFFGCAYPGANQVEFVMFAALARDKNGLTDYQRGQVEALFAQRLLENMT